ncbi:MAG: hypothetical protein ACXWG1_13025 [Usitatibacter sp.]
MSRTVFVILTSKPGEFRSEAGEGMQAVESYDYSFCGRKRARFVIAKVTGPGRVTIVDETPPPVVNSIPSKFLPKFDTVEGARRELEDLAVRGGGDCTLVRVPH